uniref:Uncharacterized protein n=1 Tax=Anopheles culicifacies TaxID=139723 RepID=A0A182LUJ7_9DIPT
MQVLGYDESWGVIRCQRLPSVGTVPLPHCPVAVSSVRYSIFRTPIVGALVGTLAGVDPLRAVGTSESTVEELSDDAGSSGSTGMAVKPREDHRISAMSGGAVAGNWCPSALTVLLLRWPRFTSCILLVDVLHSNPIHGHTIERRTLSHTRTLLHSRFTQNKCITRTQSCK